MAENTAIIETEQGINDNGQISLPYSSSLERFALVEAYITQPDGSRKTDPEASIIDKSDPLGNGVPMFSERR